MPNKLRTASPGRIRSLLSEHKTPVLLVGAGASITSGIPAAGDTVERAARWAWCKEHGREIDDLTVRPSDYLPWLSQQHWYDADLSYADLYPAAIDNLLGIASDRREFFEKLISPPVQPSEGYQSLARILHQGWIHTVLTTNFDNCIERAANLVNQPHCIYKIKTRDDLVMFSGSPTDPQLVYLHGSVEHYTDRNLTEEVQSLDEDIVERLRPLLRDHPIIVVGYRGNEMSVMEDLFLEQIEYTNSFAQGVFWCSRKSDKPTQLSPLTAKLAESIGSNFISVEIDDFDSLFKVQLWTLLSAKKTPPVGRRAGTLGNSASFDMLTNPAASYELIDKTLMRTRLLQYGRKLRFWIGESEEELVDTATRLHLVTDSQQSVIPTHGGILLFAMQPNEVIEGAKIEVRIKGPEAWLKTSLGDDVELGSPNGEGEFEVARTITGNLWNQLDELTETLSLVNATFRLKQELSKEVQAYNSLALKEAIVNALVHRDYRSSVPTCVSISPSSIRIKSPGGLIDEVAAVIGGASLENLIKGTQRGIKGYRNPVLSDLFYGGGHMDRAGSGLSDLWQATISNNGDVTFGPNVDNTFFIVELQARPEVVDRITNTAYSKDQETHRFAVNAIPFHDIPREVWCAPTTVKTMRGLHAKRNSENIPPGFINNYIFYSFYDLDRLVEDLPTPFSKNDVSTLTIDELLQLPNGRNTLVRLLNAELSEHFRNLGLWVDYKRKRTHYKKPDDESERKVTYQARVRKATRTVVKARFRKESNEIVYYEHKALGYTPFDFGDSWVVVLSPGYTFTTDGFGKTIGRERLNILSTKRAAKDFNQAVHQDVSFWISVMSGESSGVFPLICSDEFQDYAPTILLSDRPPTVSHSADSFSAYEIGWEDAEARDLDDEIRSLIEQEAEDDEEGQDSDWQFEDGESDVD